MELRALSEGFIAGGAGGFVANLCRDWWLEKQKSTHANELEKIKDSLAHGSQITRAQFDVELAAYREIWTTMADVRNHARSLLSQEKFVMVVASDRELAYRAESFAEAMQNFHSAHNAAIAATERLAPFYPHRIKQATRKVTTADMMIVNFYAQVTDETFSKPWFEELEGKIDGWRLLIDVVESLIRERLEAVRVTN